MGVIQRDRALTELFKSFDHNPPRALLPLIEAHGNFVPGDGVLNPRVIFVGEAPGRQEDLELSPFVGRSGKFLDDLLKAANLIREEAWITNVVKYRPPRNRTPEPEEIAASLPLLRREVALVAGEHRPPIVGLGSTACRALTGANISVVRSHGSWVSLKAVWRLFVSYHPAAGLRNWVARDAMTADFAKLGSDLALMSQTEKNGAYR